jgi:hypothetical protein
MPRYDTLRRLVAAMNFSIGSLHEAQRAVDGFMGRETGDDDAGGDGTLPPPPDVRTEAREPALSRETALRLGQEVGKAFAHVTLAFFLELRAGGWGEGRHGE